MRRTLVLGPLLLLLAACSPAPLADPQATQAIDKVKAHRAPDSDTVERELARQAETYGVVDTSWSAEKYGARYRVKLTLSKGEQHLAYIWQDFGPPGSPGLLCAENDPARLLTPDVPPC